MVRATGIIIVNFNKMKTTVFKIFVCVLIPLVFTQSANAGPPGSTDSIWGIGILDIYPNYPPVALYDVSNGKIIGSIFELTRYFSILNVDNESIHYEEYKRVIIIHADTLTVTRTSRTDFDLEPEEIRYNPVEISKDFTHDLSAISSSHGFLKYYQKEHGFVKILINSHKGGVWVKNTELRASFNEDMTKDYFSFITTSGEICIPASSQGLYIYEAPDVKSVSIVNMNNERFNIELTGKTEGKWAEVWVYESKPDGESYKTIRNYKGWIQVVRDNGSPNIWLRGNIFGC